MRITLQSPVVNGVVPPTTTRDITQDQLAELCVDICGKGMTPKDTSEAMLTLQQVNLGAVVRTSCNYMIWEDNVIPESEWQHSNGNKYTIVMVTNTQALSSRRAEHPETVVYRGANGNVWSRPHKDWHRSFRRIHG